MQYSVILMALLAGIIFVQVSAQAKAPVGNSSAINQNIQRSVPTTVVFRKVMERREGAFSMLIPRGWIVNGGIFRVDPNAAGGSANSIEAKCDIAIASDANGTVMLRRLPKINYADGPMIPFTHTPGMNYNGAMVVRMPTLENYLLWAIKQIRPDASNFTIVHKEGLPKLVETVRRFSEPLHRSLARVGVLPPDYHAGFIIVEYDEGNIRFKELIYTILVDGRVSMGLWWNDLTTAMRAPAHEANRWKPVMDIIANSVQLNPQWIAGELKGQGERTEIVSKLMQDFARIDREISAHRSKTQQEIMTDSYLTLTGQNDYRNPYSGRMERDTSEWKRRWVNSSGEYIYSNDTVYDPNADPNNPRHDYKLTRPVR
jgi:hypothetical protein